jgi:hypothetical protein
MTGLISDEMRARRDFYVANKEAAPSNKEDAGEVTEASYIYTADEPVSLSLQYSGQNDSQVKHLTMTSTVQLRHQNFT